MHAGRPNTCHWGLGSYGSPTDQPRCSKNRNPKRQLCDSHEKLWKPIAKARRLARIAEEIALANQVVEELGGTLAEPATDEDVALFEAEVANAE